MLLLVYFNLTFGPLWHIPHPYRENKSSRWSLNNEAFLCSVPQPTPPDPLESGRTPTPHEISGNIEGAVRMTSLARTDSIYMGFWGEWNGTQSSPMCWGQYQRVPLSAGGMWNWNNSSREGSKPHHLHEIYGVGPATELTGFDLGELLNHVWLKNSLQRIISAFRVNEKPARTIYGSKRPSIRGREKKVIKKIPRRL